MAQIVHSDAVFRVQPGTSADYDNANTMLALLAVVEQVRFAAEREFRAHGGRRARHARRVGKPHDAPDPAADWTADPAAEALTAFTRDGGIWGERPGGYGEFAVVGADAVASFPPEVDAEQMAALGLVAVTAAEGLARLDLPPGASVVVHGASGGVGSAAVALANARGCEVIAVLPRAGKDYYVRALAAARVVHLDEAGLLDALGARSVDPVLETTGARTFADSTAVLRRGGRLCLVGALTGAELALSAWDLIHELVLTGWSSENLTGDALREHVALIAELVRGERLALPAIHRFAVADAAAAHAQIEAGELTGRALLCS